MNQKQALPSRRRLEFGVRGTPDTIPRKPLSCRGRDRDPQNHGTSLPSKDPTSSPDFPMPVPMITMMNKETLI